MLPNQLFFWTKKTLKFELENWKIPILQFLKVSVISREKIASHTCTYTSQVKRRVMINKHGIYELPHELPNDLPKILGYKDIMKNQENC